MIAHWLEHASQGIEVEDGRRNPVNSLRRHRVAQQSSSTAQSRIKAEGLLLFLLASKVDQIGTGAVGIAVRISFTYLNVTSKMEDDNAPEGVSRPST